ncbi:phage tail tape measure protein [Streptomyces nigra]|uniref:phage tail tape measure protein n=1 Tax=Streptomyces nigra TaxID=1827580 RepID=UPI0037FB6BC0
MALTVGELAATITVDDTEAEQGLNGFQQRLRQALSRIAQRARTGGREAGDALGEGLDEGATQGAENAGNSITEQFNGLAMGAIGGALGAALMGGIAVAMEQEQITAKLGAQLGATPAEAKRYGEIAGDLYAHAITEDFQTAADAIRATMSAGLLPTGATNAQIEELSTHAADLATTFGLDVTMAAQAAGSMLKNGLAKNGQEAFDLLAKGMTGLGPASEDLVETFTEYGPVFKSAGISGQTALGLIRQAIQGGWVKDTDKIADAFKEFGIRGTEGSKAVQDAFQALGLDAKATGDDIAAGGKRGEDAMDKVLDRLRKMGPESQEARQIVSTLFGGAGEDLGAALFALDMDKASASMGDAAGAADKLGASLHDNAATKLEQFKRSLSQGFVEMLGGTVVPLVEKFGGFLSEWGPLLAPLAGMVIGIAAAMGIWTAAQAVFNAVMAANPVVLIIGAIIGLIAVLVIAYQKSETFRAIVQAVWGAVSAFISMHVAIIRAVIGWFANLPTLIGEWFGVAKDWAIARFTELTTWLQGLPGRALSALSSLGSNLMTAARNGFTSFRTAAAGKVSEFITYVRAIPGRISSALGNLGALLVDKGRDVVRGLWNGIKGMGSWLRSQLISFAKNMIPGPIAKALGIASPSRVMRDQIGRWIPAGVVEGVEDGAPAVEATMRNLVTVPTSGQATAATVAAHTGAVVASRAQGSAPSRVVLDVTGTDPQWKALIRRMVRVDGRGSVQLAFGS